MTEKNKVFAFVAGEVSPEFFGRRDLVKYPLGCKVVENFVVDYRGGLANRTGHEFLSVIAEQPHRWFRFRTQTHDLAMLFLANIAVLLRDGKFVSGASETGTLAGNVLTLQSGGSLTFPAGGYILINGRLVLISSAVGSTVTIAPVLPMQLSGSVTYAKPFALSHGYSAAELPSLKFFQDIKSLVVTTQSQAPKFFTRVADDSWTTETYSNDLPASPTGLTVTASATGSASVSYAISAVVNGVESQLGTPVQKTNIVNFTVTTGHMTLSWTAVPGAQRYNIYRTLVFPAGSIVGTQFGYLGFATGTDFADLNITPDFTKGPVSPIDYFAGNNFPAVYARFQQRGVYAGLADQPLTVVGSIRANKKMFSASFPETAADSYEFTIDGQVEVPIKYMLPLRYGLLLFTDEGVTQLKGAGSSTAITNASAIAEPQGYVTVSDLEPIAINLDVIFLSALGTEVNAMMYTEYTNSFKVQDIAVLSAHLFGPSNLATRATWAPEPHKVLHFIRADGQRVTLTYERQQEIFGWARQRTIGEYLDMCGVREDRYNYNYYSVRRSIGGTEAMFIERDRPRWDTSYDRTWFVDCGVERKLIHPSLTLRLSAPEDQEVPEADWVAELSDTSWASVDDRVYVKGGLFRVEEVFADHLILRVMDKPQVSAYYQKRVLRADAGEWGYNTPVNYVEGLWHLEGERVSVQADGDVFIDLPVEYGRVEFDSVGARILVGLPYRARMESLSLGLENYIIEGAKVNVRGLAFRQLNSRGIAIGNSFDEMEEVGSRRFEAWGNPLERWSELSATDLWGAGGWELEKTICMEQVYPLPTTLLGYTYDLDVGSS